MTDYFKKNMEYIEKSLHSLDDAQFDLLVNESVRALDKGHKIVVSGLGKNVPVCDKFVGTLNSLGQNACYMNTNSAVHGDLGMVQDGDIVIVLTKSGETAESNYLVDLLLKRNSNVWLITFSHNSSIEKMIGSEKCICLALDHEGDEWNIVPNNSTTVNLIVLQGLAMTVSGRRGVTLADFKRNHPGGHIGVQLKNA